MIQYNCINESLEVVTTYGNANPLSGLGNCKGKVKK